MVISPSPRSVRNCNPGNLERSSIAWLGLVSPADTAERRFCVFCEAKWGFRALALDLFTSWRRGRISVRQIVSRFAPPNENDTKAYVDAVAAALTVAPDEPLNLNDDAQLCALAKAIAVHEAGGWFFADRDLAEGIRLSRAANEHMKEKDVV